MEKYNMFAAKPFKKGESIGRWNPRTIKTLEKALNVPAPELVRILAVKADMESIMAGADIHNKKCWEEGRPGDVVQYEDRIDLKKYGKA